MQITSTLFYQETNPGCVNHDDNALLQELGWYELLDRLHGDEKPELSWHVLYLRQDRLDLVEQWSVIVRVLQHHPMALKYKSIPAISSLRGSVRPFNQSMTLASSLGMVLLSQDRSYTPANNVLSTKEILFETVSMSTVIKSIRWIWLKLGS